jgi:hypothetical protein
MGMSRRGYARSVNWKDRARTTLRIACHTTPITRGREEKGEGIRTEIGK